MEEQITWIRFGASLIGILKGTIDIPTQYVGDQNERVIQYILDITENVDVDNQIMIEDVREIAQKWVDMNSTADEVVQELASALYEYCEFGC